MTLDPSAGAGLLLYPGAQAAAVHGLSDLLSVAGRLAGTVLRVSHWQPAGDRLVPVFDSAGNGLMPAVVVLPPSLGEPPGSTPAITGWLHDRQAAGTVLCSVCAGAFLLADAGLLAGRPATTHWSYAETLASRHPGVKVDADRLIIDDGDIITAGGVMAWTDLGLILVERFFGPALMMATARFFLLDPPGREQRFYARFQPKTDHGDSAILKVQQRLAAAGPAADLGVAAMAAEAGLEERTFLRRFRKATGLRPTEYCQQLRLAAARERLETTRDAIDSIAFTVGYQDPGAFRKLFLKRVGLSPGDYRRRFGSL
ncbi:GlxA family transcriptional regulator [Zavarzinia compransoris]|uniref:AraC family transcriptional regulator n=1 Tax=Zavarzinia compransoris TaxID=1264899 RepID=A0A317E229_9PROT|nr:helix-turn-helix domain-containing protein [Zavarzinia compransoris]PWR21039.1 AraC family transcriptional regulator [Zavarzinia compransoris]TDP44072.1 AraC family transcriptional regulator with amidase-like domain [Zavarzinia compransoris]